MTMRKIFNVVKGLTFTSVLALVIVGVAGCPAGTDYSKLALEPDMIIDYGARAKEGKIPVESLAYGQLMSGDAIERSANVLANEEKDLYRGVAKVRAASTDANFTGCVDDLQQKVQAMGPDVVNAGKSANGAKNLAGVLEAYVKTGGSLEAKFAECERALGAGSKTGFESAKAELTKAFERLFQVAVVMAQSIAQKEAAEHHTKALGDLQTLENNLNNKVIFTNVAQRRAANISVKAALNGANSVNTFITDMTSKNVVGVGLSSAVVDLEAAITKLVNDYVNQATASMKTEAKLLVDDALTHAKALNKIAGDFASVESLKESRRDVKLDGLVASAFTGAVPVILGELSLERPTEVTELMQTLATNPVVIIKNDPSAMLLVYALASAVVNNVGRKSLPDADNVVGLNDDLMIKIKKDYSMTNDTFDPYAVSRGQLVHEQTTKEGQFKNVSPLFPDLLAVEGANTNNVVSELAKDGGRVLIVTNDLNKYASQGTLFVPRGMDMSSAILTATAIIQQTPNLPASPAVISEKIVRMAAASSAGVLRIADLANIAKSAASLAASTRDVNRAVVGALSRHQIPTGGAAASGILTDDLRVVQANLDRDPNYYRSGGGGAGGGATDIEERMKENEDRRKATEALKTATEDADIQRKAVQENTVAVAALNSVKLAAESKASRGALEKVSMNTRIENDTKAIKNAFAKITETMERCTIPTPIDKDTSAVIFPDNLKQSLLDENVLAPPPGSGLLRARQGRPTAVANVPADISWVSCFVFGNDKKVKINATLSTNESAIEARLKGLSANSSLCLDRKQFHGNLGVQGCMRAEVRNFEGFRKNLALHSVMGSKSLVQSVADEIDLLPLVPHEFWTQTTANGAAPLTTAINPSFGRALSLGVSPTRLALQLFNLHYYVGSLMAITGTRDGKALISSRFTNAAPENQVTDIAGIQSYNSPGHQTPFKVEHRFLKTVLRNFDDNNTLLVKARREINASYAVFVADRFAQLIYKDVVLDLYESVVKPFWTMPIEELKKFQETSVDAESVARRTVWTEFANLSGLIAQLATELNKNYVPLGHGGEDTVAAPLPGVVNLDALGVAYDDLRAKAFLIHNLLVAGAPGDALYGLDPALETKIKANIRVPLRSLIRKMSIGTNSPWTNAPFAALPLAATIGRDFLALFEAAHDLAQFNYFTTDPAVSIRAAAGGVARDYPVWHSKFGGGGVEIKHPLEP